MVSSIQMEMMPFGVSCDRRSVASENFSLPESFSSSAT